MALQYKKVLKELNYKKYGKIDSMVKPYWLEYWECILKASAKMNYKNEWQQGNISQQARISIFGKK